MRTHQRAVLLLWLWPAYHPAGASLTGTPGPLSVEAFTSDVLGARLMGTLAEGRTLLSPKVDGAVRAGAYASTGLGVDPAR